MRTRSRLLALMLALAPCGCGANAGETASAGESESETGLELLECAPISTPVSDEPGAQLLELVAIREQIPGLADQPTVRGQALGALFAFDGRLHLGYGDYSDNTGPIAMSAWDPAQATFVDLGVAPSEEIQLFFAAHGALYTPAIDPDGHQESGGVYRLDCGRQTWRVETPIDGAVHVYDVDAQGDRLFACSGSLDGAPALLMASDDRGHSWTELLRRDSAPGRYSRFYYLGATPELLFVSGRDYPTPSEVFAWVRRGEGAFEPIIDVPAGSLVPITLGDQLVVAGFSGAPGRSALLLSYTIEGQTLVPTDVWPAPDGTPRLVSWAPQPADETHGERLLVLMGHADGSASVHRSEDLALGPAAWQQLATLDLPDDGFISMALLFNDLYLGTSAGSLYALRELEAP